MTDYKITGVARLLNAPNGPSWRALAKREEPRFMGRRVIQDRFTKRDSIGQWEDPQGWLLAPDDPFVAELEKAIAPYVKLMRMEGLAGEVREQAKDTGDVTETMKCPTCEGTMVRGTYLYTSALAGFIVRDDTDLVLRCDRCSAALLSSGEVAGYERRAALEILVTAKNPVSGAVLKFARKALGLQQKELAEMLDTNEHQISLWENDPVLHRRLRLAVAGLLSLAEGGSNLDQVAAVTGSTLEILMRGSREL